MPRTMQSSNVPQPKVDQTKTAKSSAAESRPLLALLIRLGAVASLATMAALIKYAAQEGVHLIEILFWRQFLSIPLLIAFVLITRQSFQVFATKRPKAHIVRGLYGLAGMVLNFGAVIMLPLAEATTMGFTMPLWAVLLSTIFLKDRPGIWRWSAVLAGFLGVLLITQPGMGGQSIPLFGAMVALGGAFMIALISIQIADMSRTEKPITIVFYFAVVSAPICALGLPFVMTEHSLFVWGILGALAFIGAIGQYLLTAALRYGEVSSVIVMDYSSLFWAALYGYTIFGVLPSSSTWAGAPLIVAAGLTITWREHVLAKRRQKETEIESAPLNV